MTSCKLLDLAGGINPIWPLIVFGESDELWSGLALKQRRGRKGCRERCALQKSQLSSVPGQRTGQEQHRVPLAASAVAHGVRLAGGL